MVPLVLKLQHSDKQSSQWLHHKVHVVCINEPQDAKAKGNYCQSKSSNY